MSGNTGDVKYWDTSYGKALDELEGHVMAAEGGGGGDSLSDAAHTVKRLAGMKRSYNVEIKLMSDPASKGHYQMEKSEKDRRLDHLQKRLERAKTAPSLGGQSKRDELFGGKRDVEMGSGTAEGKLDEADHIQDKTEEAYKNMIGVLQETEQSANTTAVELTNQREQIGRITEDAIEIDTLLGRADRLVKVFSKRMMTDKFIQLFSCLNVSALLAIILYVLIEKVGLPSSDDADDPPDPTDA